MECGCMVCSWVSPECPTRHEAGYHGTWHIYEEHPDVWKKVFGDRPPRDPDPRKK